jgi:hypothetical protein
MRREGLNSLIKPGLDIIIELVVEGCDDSG